jgi:hypothetical protein
VRWWAEFSGNAALTGRELPPAEVLAAGQRIDSWAGQLKAAGLEGSADELRARALMDLLLGKDSRPDQAAADGKNPAAFAATINLTIPLATLLDLADRPGEIPGIGPIDPWLARDLARSVGSHPRTTWCMTVTDKQGHAIGHGCARPKRQKGPGPPGYTFTAADQHGPPGGYGTWLLRTPGDGPDLRISLDPLNTQDCDHRYPRPRPRSRGQAEAPVPGPARHVHRALLPQAVSPFGLRAQRPLRRRADGPACATAARSVAMTTASSSTRNGQSTSSPTARSGGPPRLGVSTPPSRRGTPRERDRQRARPRRGVAAPGR